MSTSTVEVPCWRVFGWSRGRWTLRSIHYNAAEAADQAEYLYHRHGTRTRVQQATRLMPAVTPPPAPTAAQRFREQQSDRMVHRRQDLGYIKSGSNGTEIPMIPKREDTTV